VAVPTARPLHHSYEAYLAALQMSNVKLEYCEDEIYTVVGGTVAHADVTVRSSGITSSAKV